MAGGFSCMNDLIVLQTTQGVCAHLLNTVPDAPSRGVVIGFVSFYNGISNVFKQSNLIVIFVLIKGPSP